MATEGNDLAYFSILLQGFTTMKRRDGETERRRENDRLLTTFSHPSMRSLCVNY